MPKILIVALLGLLLTGSAMAQAPGLVTDRPDFTESGVVVPHGSLQFEGGFTWEDGDSVRSFAGPELLVRWGLHERLEFRFGLPDYANLSGDLTASGLGDGTLGAKWQLGPVGTWDLAGILTTTVPTGEESFTSDGWDPSLIVAAGRDLDDRWSLGAQVAVESASGPLERETLFGATLVLGAGLGERTGAFLEVAAIVPESGTAPLVLHHGYTHLLTPVLQFDVHGGLGLTDTAPDVFLGAGLSYRH